MSSARSQFVGFNEKVNKTEISIFFNLISFAMDPSQLEFIGENEMIGIIPNFSIDSPVHLISGSIGPFRAGLPVHGN